MRNSVYMRKGSPYYWIRYYDGNNKKVRESSKSNRKRVAETLLRQREREVASGSIVGLHHTTTFEDLYKLYWGNFTANNYKAVGTTQCGWKHLQEYFTGWKAININTSAVRSYRNNRMETSKKRPSNATLNRELSFLQTSFRLAIEDNKLATSPNFRTLRLKEPNPRSGFINKWDYEKIMAELPKHLKGVFQFAYVTGWRKSEITGLKWERVNVKEGKLELAPGEAKSDQPRDIYVGKNLQQMFERLWNEKEANPEYNNEYVFLNRKKDGKLLDFRYEWGAACKRAGCKHIFHDCRRVAITNLINSGVPESSAMFISGHKSNSIIKRYNIIRKDIIKDALQQSVDYVANQKTM